MFYRNASGTGWCNAETGTIFEPFFDGTNWVVRTRIGTNDTSGARTGAFASQSDAEDFVDRLARAAGAFEV